MNANIYNKMHNFDWHIFYNFKDEFKDIKASENTDTSTDADGKVATSDESCNNVIANLIDSLDQISENSDRSESKINPDLAGLNLNNDAYKQIGSFMPSQLLQVCVFDRLFYHIISNKHYNHNSVSRI